MLGQRDTDTERDAFFASVDAVVEELHIGVGGCNEELYRRGGEFKPVGKFSTHIHVFQRLADCLISLESRCGWHLSLLHCGARFRRRVFRLLSEVERESAVRQ